MAYINSTYIYFSRSTSVIIISDFKIKTEWLHSVE